MQRFVIGTGRCGSTLLSTLLAQHPQALVLSEFFGGLDFINGLRDGPVSGDELAAILLRDHEISNLNRSRAKVDREILLDLKAYSSPRIPVLLLVCLPALTSDPNGLMREIVGWARAQKTRTLSEHYPNLFDWMTALFEKDFWIERSGASSEFFPGLRKVFPDAQYLHIHRDGEESALSMRQQHHFITHVSFYFDPPSDEEVARVIRGDDAPGADLISRRERSRPSPEQFGNFWTTSISLLYSQLPYLERKQYREVRFEDLRADPRAFLKAACDFFQISSEDAWIDRAIAKMRPERHERSIELSPLDREKLRAAVFPGQVLLKREGQSRPNLLLYSRVRKLWDELQPKIAFSMNDP